MSEVMNVGVMNVGQSIIIHNFPFAELSTLELWLLAMIPWLRLLKVRFWSECVQLDDRCLGRVTQ